MTAGGGSAPWSLVRNLVILGGGVLLRDGLILGLGLGCALGIPWTALFAVMALARWRLGGPDARADRGWGTGLIASSLGCPLCSLAPQTRLRGVLSELAPTALASFVVGRPRVTCRPAAACVLPVVPRVGFATSAIRVDWGGFDRFA